MSGLTAQVSHLVADPAQVAWTQVDDAVARLVVLVDAPVPDDLDRWGRALLAPDGPVPLIGLHGGAAAYPALLWDGARLARAGLGLPEGLVLLAAVTCAPEAPADSLAQGVGAGLAVDAALRSACEQDAPARATTAAVAAVACLAAAAGADDARTVEALDLAGTLMVIGLPQDPGPVERSLQLGHALAAGWLAWQLSGSGITSMTDAVGHTLATVAGRPLRPVDTAPQPGSAAGAPAGSRIGDVVRLLS